MSRYVSAEWTNKDSLDLQPSTGSDCISRGWLISFIDAGHLRNPNEKCYSENDVVELIKNAPSVVPTNKVVAQIKVDTDELMERIKEEFKIEPIVHCSDCKYNHMCAHEIIHPYDEDCELKDEHHWMYCPVDYCSAGRRKEGADNE